MTDKKTKKKCDLCETLVRGGQICSACKTTYIHFKCLDNLIKYIHINVRNQWVCKTCVPAFVLPESTSDLLDESCPENNQPKFTYLQEEITLQMEERIEEQNNIIQSQEQDLNYLEGPLITVEMPAYTTYPEIPETAAIMEPIEEKEFIEVTYFTGSKALVEFPNPIEMEYKSRKFIVSRRQLQRLIFYNARICRGETVQEAAYRILNECNLRRTYLRIFRIIRAVKRKDDPFGDAYDILVECEIHIFTQFMDKRDILRSLYKISESVDVVSCKNCHFFYRPKDLRMPVICYWCTGDHTPQDCPVIDPICSNCKC